MKEIHSFSPNDLKRHPVAPGDMPEPYRSLLAHDSDMTSTLEAFHESRIDLEPLSMTRQDDLVMRNVLLLAADKENKPVEFGAITIYLEHFPETAREMILAAERPLGWIIEHTGMIYQCDPFMTFWVEPGKNLRALVQTDRNKCYGRLNRITTPDGECLADVLEILP